MAKTERSSFARRLPGSVLGGMLTVLGWYALGLHEFVPQLLVAIVAFGVGHGVVALVMGRTRADPPSGTVDSTRERTTTGSHVPTIVSVFAAVVLVLILAAWGWNALHGRQERSQAALNPPSSASSPSSSSTTSVESDVGLKARTTTVECNAVNCTVQGPMSASVMADLRAKGLDPTKYLRWDDVDDAELATASEIADDVRDLTISCKGDSRDASVAALASRTRLEELSLYGCAIADFSPLSKLVRLRRLVLTRTPLASIAFVADLTALESFDAEGPTDLRIAFEVQRLSGKFEADDPRFAILATHPVAKLDLAPLAGLTKLQRLNLHARPIADLSALRGLIALQDLRIGATPVTNVDALRGLTSLRNLSAGNLPAKDLSPLGDLRELRSLWMQGATATDHSFVARLTKLEELDLAVTPFSQLAVVTALPALKKLELGYTKVIDWSPLRSLASAGTLEALGVSGTGFSDLALIAPMRKLTSLSLANCSVKNPHVLAGFGALSFLYMPDTSGMRLMPLIGAKELTGISAKGAKLDPSDVAAFKKARPAVNVEE